MEKDEATHWSMKWMLWVLNASRGLRISPNCLLRCQMTTRWTVMWSKVSDCGFIHMSSECKFLHLSVSVSPLSLWITYPHSFFLILLPLSPPSPLPVILTLHGLWLEADDSSFYVCVCVWVCANKCMFPLAMIDLWFKKVGSCHLCVCVVRWWADELIALWVTQTYETTVVTIRTIVCQF